MWLELILHPKTGASLLHLCAVSCEYGPAGFSAAQHSIKHTPSEHCAVTPQARMLPRMREQICLTCAPCSSSSLSATCPSTP